MTPRRAGVAANVFVSVTSQGWIHRDVALVLLELARDERFAVRIGILDEKPYESAMNSAADECLTTGCEFWLHIDADNPPTKNPIDLCALDKDVIGCPTPIWIAGRDEGRPYAWNTFDANETGHVQHTKCVGLQEVDAVGSGCFVVHRRVLEAVCPAFVTQFDAKGIRTLGADLNFCRRVKEAGFGVYAHYAYPCKHYNEIELFDAVRAYARLSVSLKQPAQHA